AVHTRADRLRHGVRAVAKPGRYDGGEATGRTTGRHDEQVIGRAQSAELLGVVAAVREHGLAGRPPIAAADAGTAEDVLTDVALGPAGVREYGANLPGKDEDVIAGPDRVGEHVGPDLGRHGVQDRLGVGAPLVHHLAWGLTGKHRHRRGALR